MKWEPWITFKKTFKKTKEEEDILPIYEPPCKNCRHWRPGRFYSSTGMFDGIIACRSADMHYDFSCYEDKDRIVK